MQGASCLSLTRRVSGIFFLVSSIATNWCTSSGLDSNKTSRLPSLLPPREVKSAVTVQSAYAVMMPDFNVNLGAKRKPRRSTLASTILASGVMGVIERPLRRQTNFSLRFLVPEEKRRR